MTSYTQTATIYNPWIFDRDTTRPVVGEEKNEKAKVIVVNDIKELTDIANQGAYFNKYLALAGIIPNPQTTENVVSKGAITLIISAFFAIWQAHDYLYGLFIISIIINLFTSLIIDKDVGTREKLGRFGADLFLGAVAIVLLQVIVGDIINFPMNLFSVSTIGIVLTFLSVSNVWLSIKRIIPHTSLFQSGVILNLATSISKGWNTTCEEFQNRQKLVDKTEK